jgi:sulfur transfer complex TusBCD TusB component (DsrH family)
VGEKEAPWNQPFSSWSLMLMLTYLKVALLQDAGVSAIAKNRYIIDIFIFSMTEHDVWYIHIHILF